MHMFNKPDASTGQSQNFETIIGANITVEGNLNGKGNILIEGSVSGEIKTDQDITIEEGADIKANIHASSAHIGGKVTGNIIAKKQVVLKQSSQIIGDITAESIEIHAGAIFNGRSNMGNTSSTPKKNDTAT